MRKYYTMVCLALSLGAQQPAAAQKLQSTFIESWDGSAWSNGQKNTYVYDSNNNLLSLSSQLWTNSAWENISTTTYTNDGAGNPIVTLNQVWTVSSGSWNNSSRTTATYTANKPLVMTYESWNGTAWQNRSKYIFAYDNNLSVVSQTFQTWTGGTWVNSTLSSTSNNTAGNPTVSLSQTWLSATSTWSNNSRATTTYTASKPLTVINERWIGNSWQNLYKYDHDYDNNLNETSQLMQRWSGSSWENNMLYSYTNNASGNPTLTLIQTWPGAAATWSNSTRIVSTYLDIPSATGIEQYTAAARIKAYPVPATDQIYIDSDENTAMCSISDIAGKQVLTASISRGNNAIDISGLPAGVYFLKQENGQPIKIIKK